MSEWKHNVERLPEKKYFVNPIFEFTNIYNFCRHRKMSDFLYLNSPGILSLLCWLKKGLKKRFTGIIKTIKLFLLISCSNSTVITRRFIVTWSWFYFYIFRPFYISKSRVSVLFVVDFCMIVCSLLLILSKFNFLFFYYILWIIVLPDENRTWHFINSRKNIILYILRC